MSACAASNNYRFTVTASNGDGKVWGTVTVSRGPVAPGEIADVRTPDGHHVTRRIYYYRKDGREFIRLVCPLNKRDVLHHPLSEVRIEGTVICVVKVGERCEECDAAQRREQRAARARVQTLERAVKGLAQKRERGVRREIDLLDWPEYIGETA